MRHRIAFCITELDPGGAEQAFVRLVLGLNREEWEPRVYCLQGRGELVETLEQSGIPVEGYDLHRTWQLPAVLWKLARSLRRFRPEILQTWLYHANLLGRMAGTIARTPRIVSGIRVAEHRSRWRLRWDRWTSALVDRHVCVSSAVEAFSRDVGRLPEEKLVSIPNGVDFGRFASAVPANLSSLGINESTPVATFIGRLHPQKRPDLFLEAALRLLPVYPQWRFLLVGDGPMKSSLEARIRSRNASDRVLLLGRRDDVPGLLKASSCFVLTSDWEGLPNVVLEAMAAGTPVVCTEVEGLAELIPDRSLGMVVPKGDPEALAAAIVLTLTDPHSARRMSEGAQVYVKNNFTWDRFVRSHCELYEELFYPI